MPYIFSDKQINHVYHLLIEHKMDINKIADVMNTSIVSARHLIKLARQRYPKEIKACVKAHKVVLPVKKYSYSKSTQEVKPVAFIRPKAEYSNKRIYDLI